MTGKFFLGDLMKNITSLGLPRATEPQVTDLGDTCLFKYLQLRDPLTVCIWRPRSQSQALGEHRGVAVPPCTVAIALDPIPEPKGISKKGRGRSNSLSRFIQ